jgi:hypothetical protein
MGKIFLNRSILLSSDELLPHISRALDDGIIVKFEMLYYDFSD